MNASELLPIFLQAAVPIRIAELKKMTLEQFDEYVNERRYLLVEIIGSKGDNILYRSKKPGETAAAVNDFAEAVAILAFAEGGVTIFGLHFEAKHGTVSQDRERETDAEEDSGRAG